MTKSQTTLFAGVLIIIAALGAWAAFAYTKKAQPATVPTPVVATTTQTEATSTPTKPEPAPTPVPQQYGTTTVSLGEKIQMGDITVTPLAVTEDSRCPLGVLCMRFYQGTVTVDTRITTSAGSLTQALSLEKPFIIGNHTITLVGVQPIKRQHGEIQPSEYQLTFDIK